MHNHNPNIDLKGLAQAKFIKKFFASQYDHIMM